MKDLRTQSPRESNCNPLGNKFKWNKLVARFTELRNFTTLTGFNIGEFEDSKLTTVVCPNHLETIAQAAFHTGSLENITLPSQCVTIGLMSLAETSIKKLVIPAHVTTITNRAIRSNMQLESLVMLPTAVPSLGTENWYRVPYVTIYVPDESIEAYKTAPNWSDKAGYIKPMSEYED